MLLQKLSSVPVLNGISALCAYLLIQPVLPVMKYNQSCRFVAHIIVSTCYWVVKFPPLLLETFR